MAEEELPTGSMIYLQLCGKEEMKPADFKICTAWDILKLLPLVHFITSYSLKYPKGIVKNCKSKILAMQLVIQII